MLLRPRDPTYCTVRGLRSHVCSNRLSREKKEPSLSIDVVKNPEKSFFFGTRNSIFLGTDRLRFLSEVPWENVIFVFFYFTFISFLFYFWCYCIFIQYLTPTIKLKISLNVWDLRMRNIKRNTMILFSTISKMWFIDISILVKIIVEYVECQDAIFSVTFVSWLISTFVNIDSVSILIEHT